MEVENVHVQTATIGQQQLINKFSDLLRQELALCGYTECLNWCLCSIKEITEQILVKRDDFITIGNPKTTDFQTARTTLIPGLLKTLKSN